MWGWGGGGALERAVRSEPITDKSDIKAGVAAKVQHREGQKTDWGGWGGRRWKNAATAERAGKGGRGR